MSAARPYPPFVVQQATVRHERTAIPQPVKTAFGTMHERHAVFLLLSSAQKQVGVGESWVNFPHWAPWERVAAYEQSIIPWLTGREISDVITIMQELYAALRGPAVQSGTVPALVQALCGVELALWDLAAQAAGLSLSQLLFPTPHARVEVYASGINAPLPWPLINAHLDRGVRLFKLKLGFGDDEDRRNLLAMKRHLGHNAALAVDVNRGWSLAEARAWLPFLAEQEIVWLEEPLRPELEDALETLCAESPVPLAGCENRLMPPGLAMDAIAGEKFDILQPDITKYTPLHQALALKKAGETLGKPVVPHFLGSGPGQAASLQLTAGCARGLVELDINENPLRTALCAEPFVVEDGQITLPDRPGLGWTLAANPSGT